MANADLIRIREQLRKNLFEITLDFGSTYPVKRQRVRENSIIPAKDFPKLYPNLKSLSHYTNSAGLKGILNSGTLWATSASHFNDPEELKYAYHRFVSMIRNGEHALDRAYADALVSGLRTTGCAEIQKYSYLISFSAKQDDLSQFRAYSDNTHGYALEFEPVKLVAALNTYINHDHAEHFTLRQVQYGDESLKTFHHKAIGAIKKCISELPYEANTRDQLEAIRGFGMDCQDYLREAGVTFKQNGYCNEEEYRAVLDVHGLIDGALPLYLDEKIAVRFRDAMPIPYIPVQFLPPSENEGYFNRRDNIAGLKRIVVGPGIDFKLAETGMFYLLRENGLHNDVEIVSSTSTYKRW